MLSEEYDMTTFYRENKSPRYTFRYGDKEISFRYYYYLGLPFVHCQWPLLWQKHTSPILLLRHKLKYTIEYRVRYLWEPSEGLLLSNSKSW